VLAYELNGYLLTSNGKNKMEESKTKLTEMQFTILDGMADDYEDVEQLYLYANREPEEVETGVQFPRMLIQVRFPLREVVDEIANMLRQGIISVQYTNDEQVAPLQPINFSALHHYWFGATDAGTRAWIAHRTATERGTQ